MSIQTPPPPPPAYQPPPAQGPGDARAQAKAAQAYAKAQRPWFKKKRFIGLGALVVLVIVIAAATSGGSKKTPSASQPSTTASAPAAATTAAQTTEATSKAPVAAGGSALPIQNGDWRLDSIRVKDDGLGSFGGVARVTYTGSDANGGTNVFTVTVFKGTKDIAVLNGSAESAKPGRAVTVQFISSDKFVAGPFTYDFQKDL
jgi:hypothetical protein